MLRHMHANILSILTVKTTNKANKGERGCDNKIKWKQSNAGFCYSFIYLLFILGPKVAHSS